MYTMRVLTSWNYPYFSPDALFMSMCFSWRKIAWKCFSLSTAHHAIWLLTIVLRGWRSLYKGVGEASINIYIYSIYIYTVYICVCVHTHLDNINPGSISSDMSHVSSHSPTSEDDPCRTSSDHCSTYLGRRMERQDIPTSTMTGWKICAMGAFKNMIYMIYKTWIKNLIEFDFFLANYTAIFGRGIPEAPALGGDDLLVLLLCLTFPSLRSHHHRFHHPKWKGFL